MNPDQLTVVIPTHRRPAILHRTLSALDQQSVTGFRTVVVVDGASADVVDHPGITVLDQEHSGPSVARNRGVAATDTPLILFLGDDMIPDPDLVVRHLEWHERRPDPEVAVLGHVTWHPEVARNRVLRWLDWSNTQFEYERIAGQGGQDVGFGRFYSSNVSIKRELFDSVGGFDEDFFFLYEDIDLGWRLAQQGMQLIYEPKAIVRHLHDYEVDQLLGRFETTALAEQVMAAKHDWFEPHFAKRFERAKARPPSHVLWTHLVDWIPRGSRFRKRAEQRADDWYLQRFADQYLHRHARAAAVGELMQYLGDEFDPRKLITASRDVDEEHRKAIDEETFYRTSTAYLYDLTVFGMSPTKDPYADVLRELVPAPARILDWGCGIGADGLRFLEEGYHVTFADYKNPSTEYLAWRLERRDRTAPILDIERDEIPDGFDLVYSFDVIEHVADPIGFLERLEASASIVLVNLLEEEDHDHDHDLHHDLPIEQIIERARQRGLLHQSLHHGRSHLIAYRGGS